jgi:hypothetical protein
MSDTITEPTPELLDSGQVTPEWRDFRDSPKDWGLPRGTYDAVLREVTTVRRKDTGQYVLRLLALTQPRGKYALVWVPLGEDDAYELKSTQWKRLVKFAAGMGIKADFPDEVVDRLGQLVGSLVSVRVVHTPIGPRATMSLPEAPIQGEVMSPNGTEFTADEAAGVHAMHERLVAGLGDTRRGFLQAAEACWALIETEGWMVLGYESLKEYLASPEIGLRRSAFYDLAAIYRTYVVEGGITPERLLAADHSKLAVAVPALSAGKVEIDEAIADAEALPWRDMREKYKGLIAGPEDLSNDPGPDEGAVCSECGRPL